MTFALEHKILKFSRLPLPQHLEHLPQVLTGKTGKSSAGFPFITAESFQTFLGKVPHLFSDGAFILNWLSALRANLEEDSFSEEEFQNIQASIRVVETIVLTSAVTSVPDLWVLKWVLSVWKEAGALSLLAEGAVAPGRIQAVLLADERLFANDLALLISRGLLERDGSGKVSLTKESGALVAEKFVTVPEGIPADMTEAFASLFASSTPPQNARVLVQKFLVDMPTPSMRNDWRPTFFDIEAGWRLAPLVLALRLNQQADKLRVGHVFGDIAHDVPQAVLSLLRAVGYLDDDQRVTRLGDRVFSRGPGPFGIIHAYYPYMAKLSSLIKGESAGVWVERGKNVAASQDANRKTFELANQSLDQFCRDTGFQYEVFIEHAVGQGEATRQRFRKPGGDRLYFFGADLEDAAINAAVEQQRAGILPPNMRFIRRADIGQPTLVTNALKEAGLSTQGAVVMVGNGFHEVRGQTNETMVEVFKGYCSGGIVLIFTEESGLSDDDLLATGWNTYHAGFRYVHELSGQGLRPAHDRDDAPRGRFSWGKCATRAGYCLLKTYTTRTRTIFPHPREDGYNPSISVNYFCVPRGIAEKLGLGASDFQQFPEEG